MYTPEQEALFERMRGVAFKIRAAGFRSATEARDWLRAVLTTGPVREGALGPLNSLHPHPRPEWSTSRVLVDTRAPRHRRVRHLASGTYIDVERAFETPRERFVNACRRAVLPGIQAFRAEVACPPVCPLLRAPLDRATADVDHAPPHTFATIATEFAIAHLGSLARASLPIYPDADVYRDVAYEHHGGLDDVSVLPRDLREAFCRFHDERARLRWVGRHVNRVMLRSKERCGLLARDEDAPGIPWKTADHWERDADWTDDDGNSAPG